tara:strand:- start:19207 stop:21759 length:2553 start_codon:yes stop_codon:yes gene_type:complete
MTVPLKLKDSDGAELAEFSSAEENYLAFLTGQHMAGYSAGTPGTLTTTASGVTTNIGSITDTKYDQSVGHNTGSGLQTITTTTSSLLQAAGSISDSTIRSHANFRLPVMQRDSDGQRVIREMNDSDMDSLVTRLRSRIFVSDYPSTFRLGSSTPAGSYTTYLSGIASDTRTDGTNLSYNIYRKTNDNAPTKVLPFSIKRDSGATGAYQGLQLMTDQQVRQTFADYVRNKIAANVSSNGIGTYKLYPSGTTPTGQGLSGTWAAKGTATDTRQVVADQNYTRSREQQYTKLRNATYSAAYARTRSSTYIGVSESGPRTSTYTATRVQTRNSNYNVSGFLGDFTGNYSSETDRIYSRLRQTQADYTGNFTGEFSAVYQRLSTFLGNYGAVTPTSTVVTDYLGNSTTDFIGVYSRSNAFLGNYLGDYARDYLRDSQRISTAGNYSRDFQGDYNRDYTRTRESNYQRTGYLDSQRTRYTIRYNDSNRVRETSFTGNFQGDYNRGYSRNYLGNFLNTTGYQRDFQRGSPKQGTLQQFTGNFVGVSYFTRQRQNYAYGWSGYYYAKSNSTTDDYWRVDYQGTTVNLNGGGIWAKFYGSSTDYASVYLGAQPGTPDSGNISDYFTQAKYDSITSYNFGTAIPSYKDFISNSWDGFESRIVNVTGVISGAYEYERGSFVYNQTSTGGQNTYYYRLRRRVATYYTGNYAAEYTTNFSRAFERSFDRFRETDSNNSFAGDFAGEFAGDFLGDYAGDYTRNYTRNFSRVSQRSFDRLRSSNYSGGDAYLRTFTGNFAGNFTRTFTIPYEGNYNRSFIGNYTGNYQRNFLGNFLRNFLGNYAGATITNNPENIETYTLYVRTA